MKLSLTVEADAINVLALKLNDIIARHYPGALSAR